MVAFDISFCVQACLCLIGIQYVFSQPSATFDHSCYKTGDTAVLTVSYSPTGAETVTAINWYFSKATGNNVRNTVCAKIAEDSAFPNVRMTYNCTDSASSSFKATISNIEEADFGEWGASFGLSVGEPTNTAKVDMTRCDTTDDGGLSGGEIAGIVIGSVVGAGIVIGVIIFLCVKANK